MMQAPTSASALASAPMPSLAAPPDELDAYAGDRSFVMSFARGVSVIQAFARVTRPLSIAEISHRIHIPRAAVRRLLHTLGELGYVRMVGLRYALTPKTLELGNAFSSSNDIAIGVQTIVTRLADRLHAFCALAVPENDDSMLMCLAGTSTTAVARNLTPAPGSKAPLYASASGLLFLSAMSEAQLDAYFARVSMMPITFRTQTVPAQLRETLRRVRGQGYAICDRTFANDLRSIAVPVRDVHGQVVAALAVVAMGERLSDAELHATLLPALLAAAEEAGQKWRAHWC